MSSIHGWLGRRDLVKGMIAAGIGSLGAGLGWGRSAQAADLNPSSLDPDAALKRLIDGNQRFMQHKPNHPDQTLVRMQEISQSQHPFVTVLSCADSRVAAEIVFDEGLGDIFDVRIAGNVVTPEALGSIEYAAILLGTPLLMVLGHERCGAVTAAVQQESVPGSIGSFVKLIEPVVAQAKARPGNPVENAVVANVQYQIERLKQESPLMVELVNAGKLKIVGGRYDLDSGEVSLVA